MPTFLDFCFVCLTLNKGDRKGWKKKEDVGIFSEGERTRLTGRGRRRRLRGQKGTAGRVIRSPGPPRVRWIGGTALLIHVFIHKGMGCVSEGRLRVPCWSCNSCVSYLQSPPCTPRPSASRAGASWLHPTLLPTQAALVLNAEETSP